MSYWASTTMFFGWCTDHIDDFIKNLLPDEHYESFEYLYENKDTLNQKMSDALGDITDKCKIKFDKFYYQDGDDDLYYLYFSLNKENVSNFNDFTIIQLVKI